MKYTRNKIDYLALQKMSEIDKKKSAEYRRRRQMTEQRQGNRQQSASSVQTAQQHAARPHAARTVSPTMQQMPPQNQQMNPRMNPRMNPPRSAQHDRPAPRKNQNVQRGSASKKTAPRRFFDTVKAYLSYLSDLFFLNHPFSMDIFHDAFFKSLAYGVAIMLTAVLQTTVFASFRFFDATPDLMLMLVITIAMFEREKGGAACGIFAGFLVEALGSTGISFLPLIYMFCGIFVGWLTYNQFTCSIPVWILYALAGGVVRVFTSVIYAACLQNTFVLDAVLTDIVLPELGSTLIMAPFAALIGYLASRFFHRKES